MLEEVILADIRSMLRLTVNEEKARKYFLKRKSGTIAVQTAENIKKIKQAEKRLMELEKLIRSVYEDKVMGRVAEDMALSLLDDYQKEKEKLSSELNDLRNKLESQKQDSDDVDDFIRCLKMFAGAEVLTREMALQLIEYVTIDENPHSRKRVNKREIHIYYKIIDNGLNNPLNALE